MLLPSWRVFMGDLGNLSPFGKLREVEVHGIKSQGIVVPMEAYITWIDRWKTNMGIDFVHLIPSMEICGYVDF